MRNFSRALIIALVGLTPARPALADDEASNLAHVVAGPYGRGYTNSVPDHDYDSLDQPRQQGRTMVYRVGNTEDVPVHTFDWFSQQLFVLCGPTDSILVARLGPWHCGHNPHADHLAIAFYRGDKLLKRYSTMDIAGEEKAQSGGNSICKNVSASVSHYSVFGSAPEMIRITRARGAIFEGDWVIRAGRVNGCLLTFSMTTGELR